MEITPMRILAWRGQMVEGFGNKRKRLMGIIGNQDRLATYIKHNDWKVKICQHLRVPNTGS